MSLIVFAVDPGTTESAIVSWDGVAIGTTLILENEVLIFMLKKATHLLSGRIMAIEEIRSYGMCVGMTTFDTCRFTGRLQQVALDAGATVRLIERSKVKLHHCGQARAKDANVSQALRDRFGEKKDSAVTRKLSSHLWQAFALAVYCYDTTPRQPE